MKKYFLFSLIFLLIICGCGKKQDLNESDFVAQIYHSEMRGIDAATTYRYYIYRDGKNFKYVKTKSSITIAGEGEAKEIKKGKIKTKTDLIELDKDIEKDKINGATTDITYFYREEDGTDTRYDSIEALTDRVFKQE